MKRFASFLALCSLATIVTWGCNSDEDTDTGCDPLIGSTSHEAYSMITTFAGNGIQGAGTDGVCPLKTALYWPQDLAFSPDNKAYIIDWNNYRIRVVENGLIHSVIGSGNPVPDGESEAPTGPALEVDLNHPAHLNFDANGNIILSGFHSSAVFLCNLSTNTIAPIAGNGVRCYGGDGGLATSAIVNLPVCSHYDSQGNLYVSDQANQRIRKIDASGNITTFAGSAQPNPPGSCTIPGSFSGDGGPPELATFNFPVGQQAYPAGKFIIGPGDRMYIADTKNQRIRMIADGIITTVAGNGTQGYGGDGGPATDALLNNPNSVALDPEGNLYISDYDNHIIRKVEVNTNIITTFAGHPPSQPCQEPGCSAFEQWCPRGDCTDVTSLSSEEIGDGGDPKDAYLHNPAGLAFDAEGNLYIADRANNRIRVVLRNP